NPNTYVLLAADRFAFAAAYGGTVPVLDTFPGILGPGPQLVTLVQPGPPGLSNVITRVRYESAGPWPATIPGKSLQLLDSSQDNWRVANWSAPNASPGKVNFGATSLPP